MKMQLLAIGAVLILGMTSTHASYAQTEFILQSSSDTRFGLNESVGAAIDESEDSVWVGVSGLNNQIFDFSSIWYDLTPVTTYSTRDTSFAPGFSTNSLEHWLIKRKEQIYTELTYRSVSDQQILLGASVGFPTLVFKTKALKEWVFPLKLGSAWRDTAEVESGSKTYTLKYSAIVDASGTLKTQEGEWPSLRVKRIFNYGSFSRVVYTYLTQNPMIGLEIYAGKLKPSDTNKVQPSRIVRFCGPPKYAEARSPSVLFQPFEPFLTDGVAEITREIVFKNTGDTTLRARRVYLQYLSGDSDFTVLNPEPFNLEPGEQRNISVRYRPSKPASAALLFGDFYFIVVGFQLTGAAQNLAVESASNPSSITAYPNPNHGRIQLGGAGWLGYELFDLTGNKVLSNSLNPNILAAIDLPRGLRSDTYFLHAWKWNTQLWFKLLLER